MSNPDNLTEAQAAEHKRILERYYGDTVRPVSEVCKGITEWMRAVEAEHGSDEPIDVFEGQEAYLGKVFRQHGDRVELATVKSNLLYRLLYLGEKLRTEKCPEHKGRWVGYGDCVCNLQGGGGWSDMTGWLPEGLHIDRPPEPEEDFVLNIPEPPPFEGVPADEACRCVYPDKCFCAADQKAEAAVWDGMDALEEACLAWETYISAQDLDWQHSAYDRLCNAMSDLASWSPHYDVETGTFKLDENDEL